jgi:lycopene epsilon-cyclase
MWRGYMASKLTSSELIGFALLTFVLADPGIKYKLIHHLVTDPSGGYLVSGYAKLLGLTENQDPSQQQQGELPTPQSQVA